MKKTRSDELDFYLALSKSRKPRERVEALGSLCPCRIKYNVPEVWERIFELARDPDHRVRGAALHNLADGSPRELEPRIVSVIEAMQHDEDRKLRRRARQLLAHYQNGGRLNVL